MGAAAGAGAGSGGGIWEHRGRAGGRRAPAAAIRTCEVAHGQVERARELQHAPGGCGEPPPYRRHERRRRRRQNPERPLGGCGARVPHAAAALGPSRGRWGAGPASGGEDSPRAKGLLKGSLQVFLQLSQVVRERNHDDGSVGAREPGGSQQPRLERSAACGTMPPAAGRGAVHLQHACTQHASVIRTACHSGRLLSAAEHAAGQRRGRKHTGRQQRRAGSAAERRQLYVVSIIATP